MLYYTYIFEFQYYELKIVLLKHGESSKFCKNRLWHNLPF